MIPSASNLSKFAGVEFCPSPTPGDILTIKFDDKKKKFYLPIITLNATRKEKKIIVNKLKSDDAVLKLFDGIGKSVWLTNAPYFNKTIEDVNKFFNNSWRVRIYSGVRKVKVGRPGMATGPHLATLLRRGHRDIKPAAGSPGGDPKLTGVYTAPPEAEEDNRRIMGFKRDQGGVGTPRTRDHMRAKPNRNKSNLIVILATTLGEPSPLSQSLY
ncbi:hypothetical protein RHSIM_Rhsim01G0051600 [Rhododendron simsii]|uniref:Uncharacterized protein n=1 Tax=Rhododendron simsii TaxID=118357 RepID=A0A834HHE7_RHOSS|nr:hypothetical protein RHSIM_Rhsim01G0051600 [Rhododendron simsii]